jgi:hypothetical protein
MFTYNEQGEKMKELMINKEGHVWNIFDYILYLENKIDELKKESENGKIKSLQNN